MIHSKNGIGAIGVTGIRQTWNPSPAQTVEIALKYRVINTEPDEGAYRSDLAEAALKLLGDEFDAQGEKFEPIKVELKEGGK